MLALKYVFVLGIILNFTLARPNQRADVTVLNQSQKYINDDGKNNVVNAPFVRRKRFVFGALQSLASFGSLQSLGVRGDWRFCRYTRDGASVYTNGIDVVCQGLCADNEITCNDYYRPYFYNYFN